MLHTTILFYLCIGSCVFNLSSAHRSLREVTDSLNIFDNLNDISENTITWPVYQRLFPDIHINDRSEFHFLENLKYIISHNSVERSYRVGITKFMHFSDDEWQGMFHNMTENLEIQRSENLETFEDVDVRAAPSSWDWRDHGVVTPVKDQKTCGSCYSFSATETVETTWAIKSGQLLVLSPQQVVDCSKLNSGCNGGLQSRVYKYLESTKQCLESSYPYTGVDGTCHSCEGAVSVLSGYTSLKAGDETGMGSAVLVTSLAVAIQADQKEFQMYKSGVLDFNCGTNLDHAVTVEGYGTESGKDYWIVRNSWGNSWGDKGYVKMARGKNLCGIADSIVYPKF